jgi:hypothetical protein
VALVPVMEMLAETAEAAAGLVVITLLLVAPE